MRIIFRQMLFGCPQPPRIINCPRGCDTAGWKEDTFFCQKQADMTGLNPQKLGGEDTCPCLIDESIYNGLLSIFRGVEVRRTVWKEEGDLYFLYEVAPSDQGKNYNLVEEIVESFKKR